MRRIHGHGMRRRTVLGRPERCRKFPRLKKQDKGTSCVLLDPRDGPDVPVTRTRTHYTWAIDSVLRCHGLSRDDDQRY